MSSAARNLEIPALWILRRYPEPAEGPVRMCGVHVHRFRRYAQCHSFCTARSLTATMYRSQLRLGRTMVAPVAPALDGYHEARPA